MIGYSRHTNGENRILEIKLIKLIADKASGFSKHGILHLNQNTAPWPPSFGFKIKGIEISCLFLPSNQLPGNGCEQWTSPDGMSLIGTICEVSVNTEQKVLWFSF